MTEQSIRTLKGIGPSRAKLFANLGIETLGDLLSYIPRDYEDRSRMRTISELEPGVPTCFSAMVMEEPRCSRYGYGSELVRFWIADSTGKIRVTYFNQVYRARQMHYGETYIFYGSLDENGLQMVNPVVESPTGPAKMTRRILPVYGLTAGLSNATVVSAVEQAMELCPEPEESLPDWILQKYDLMPIKKAYRAVHQPENWPELQAAQKRFAFQQAFLYTAALRLMRRDREQLRREPFLPVGFEPFLKALPFTFTEAQKKAVGEILADLNRPRPMNRLLQGDVGSGKTVVAAAAMYAAAKNGWQTALMAPTELLAEQHARTLGKLLEPLGISCVLLTGRMSAPQRRQAQAALETGTAQIAIGTHALLSQTTQFRKLGLVITDEQQRFGVAQRAALWEKGENAHLLVMSATPIPRTLALILYGDLDISILDALPPGRQPVDTFLVNESYRQRLNGFLRKEAESGGQCYIVCPAIEEGEMDTGKSAKLWAETLSELVFPDLSVGLLHGKMKPQEKEAAMEAFLKGETQILVSTTVVEVGVDVPNATVMVIEDADRFGLSQLHQLRGRVGRGSRKSWCILVSQTKSRDTVQRLRSFCKNRDGFRIAQEDLKLRGPGDFLGQRQHGTPVLDLSSSLEILKEARTAAEEWSERTPGKADAAIQKQLSAIRNGRAGSLN